MNGSVVDLVLIGLLLIFAFNGYRQGFVVGLLSFAGFFSGALVGLQLGPLLADRFDTDAKRVLVSIIVIFGLAVFGQAVAGFLGSRLRGAIRHRGAQRVDDAGGAVVSVIAVLLVIWLVATPLSQSSLPWLARAVSNSIILKVVDKAMPSQARALSQALQDTVNTRGFPRVFDNFGPTREREVPAPNPALANSPVVKNSQGSVLKVLGNAQSCSRRIEGTGFVYANERVMTNAHVVAGTKSVKVEVGDGSRNGKVVVYDPERDLAVIHVPGLKATPLNWAPKQAASGADAVVLGYPLDGPYDAQEARVREVRNITGPDIYDNGQVTREVYTIKALVRSGNSGGPLMSSDGTVLGVIFAAAADDQETGFAVTAAAAQRVADLGKNATSAISTGECA
ncbi:MarP family serine protease [Virgisporangium ochraceum]|uniref:MarP family serine protease n=1 Tax=Virgisporangium ochraceum TaxID=65505 RepID=UPI001EF17A87|nr:MarP family serine protease [Virgisporangium ochraceum]